VARGLFFFPPRGCEALVLQEGECDQRHQRVSVQARPGPTLEVIEPKLFLELLVRLLADPARLDRCCKTP
jgi:hypothetical protein